MDWFATTELAPRRAWSDIALVGERMLLVASQRSRSASTVGAPAATRFAAICSFRDGTDQRGSSSTQDRRRGARTALGLDRWPWDEHTVAAEPFDSADAAELRHELACELLERYGGDTEPGEADARRPCWPSWSRATPTAPPVGCGALLDLGDDAAEIKRMFVRPDARGQDLSRRLLEALEREAAAPRVRPHAGWRPGSASPRRCSLYRTAGYEEIEKLRALPRRAAVALLRAQARLAGQPSGSGRGGRSRGTTSTATIAARISAAPSQETAHSRSSASR